MLPLLTALICSLLTISVFSNEDELREDLFPSSPEQIATLTSESGYLIGGIISPLSGQPILKQTDLIAKGAQSIHLTRTYLAPSMPCSFVKVKRDKEEYDRKHLLQHLQDNYKGWQFYPHLRLEIDLRSNQLRLADPSGMTLDFHFSESESSLASPPYAISNVEGEMPSGQYDPRNTRFFVKEGRIHVHVPDGTTRIYTKVFVHNGHSAVYYLSKEILPNGKVLKYHYQPNGSLQLIQALDPHERYIYSSLNMEGTRWDGHCHFTTSSGLTADYNYTRREIDWDIKTKKKKPLKVKRAHETAGGYAPPILTSVSSPYYRHESLEYCDRFLLSFYSGKENMAAIHIAATGSKSNKHYRAHKLQFPVGKQDTFQTVHEITYNPANAGQGEGSTTVNNSDGTSTVYHFSRNLLTTCIQYLDHKGHLNKEKVFSWDGNNWLEFLEVRDGNKKVLYRRDFQYDRYGNPIVEMLRGDLTGEGTVETLTTTRIFSDDGRNLLLREESENGKAVCYTYLSGTNLVTSKLTQSNGQVILREWNVYDDCNNLIQSISDDGSAEGKDDLTGVTQRTLKTYTLRQAEPFLHMPEWIEESYWEDGFEKLLKRTHLVYDQHGNVAEEEVYDAEGQHAYTICKTYNERGDVLTETNRFGQQAVYTYDARGHLESALNFSHRLQTTYHHDKQGRLREQIEQGDDGITHVTSSDYDFHDRKIQTKDLFGNLTRYTYNPLIDQVIQTDFPAIASPDGKAIAVATWATHDTLGRQLSQTDENGHITTYRCNIYGSPTEITYPHGGKEQFSYAKNGKCASYTDPDGLTIYYDRDPLGRLLSKTYVSSEGQTIAQETFTYNGFNVLTETDKEGNTKYSAYDGAGRKIREEFCGRITEFSYDTLGWLGTVTQHNGSNTLQLHYTYDLEGKVIEERKTDTSNNILYQINYSYDTDGNQTTVTRHINGSQATDTFVYDSFQRQTLHRDAKGHQTTTVYDESYINTLGQKVLQTRETDPLQITRIETQDSLARLVKKEVINSQNNTIACEEWLRDAHGNVVCHQDHIYVNEILKNIHTIHYCYTPNHQIASFTRAFARTTAYTYFPSGKVATKTLPDGITLAYTYHPLGFMSRLDSSDGTIHHAFDHNLLGHLLYAVDEGQQLALSRQVDPFGNVMSEVLPSGFTIEKEYDALNRTTALKMANQGEVLYTHDPLFLRKVTRVSREGTVLYEHTYNDYDLSGHLLTEKLIGNAGAVTHATDLNGSKLSISSPYFSEQCEYDPVNNLIHLTTNGIDNQYTYDQLSQLTSENSCSYLHDSMHNRVQKDGKDHEINALNELIAADNAQCTYDDRGNQIIRQTLSDTFYFVYDPLNRVIEALSPNKKISFSYDPLDRRLAKVVHTKNGTTWSELYREQYLYDGQHEIGAFDASRTPKNLKIVGLAKPVAIELAGQSLVPILDVQGNIRRLVDPQTQTIADSADYTAFGEELHTISRARPFNPWRYASKRLDPELNLINFGKRYYDPLFGRWLTTDPAGFVDSYNLYQYVLNNPFKYADPNGEFVFAVPLVALTWKVVAVALVGAYVQYQLEQQQKHSNNTYARDFNSAAHAIAQNLCGAASHLIEQGMHIAKKKQIDERLPQNPDDLLKNPDWQETSHPDAKEKGHRTFENKKTGEKLRHDEGRPGNPGHEAYNHYHRPNPNKTGKHNEYLDNNYNAVSRHSDASHLYAPENIWRVE